MEMNGRYDHIEDILVALHSGQWFGFSDFKNKIYANLIIHNSDYDKPTEKSLTDALAKQQSDFDAQAYARNRQVEYPSLDQVTVALAEKMEGNGTMWDTITAERLSVKAKFPKS